MIDAGYIHLYNSPDAASDDYTVIADVSDDVWWLGSGGFHFDPDFPEEPYLYYRHRGPPGAAVYPEFPQTAWDTTDKQEFSSKGCTPNTNQYCRGLEGGLLCETFDFVDRITLDVAGDMTMLDRVHMLKSACSVQFSHQRSGFEFLGDGSMVVSYSDDSLAGFVYDEGTDRYGVDACFNTAAGYPQGLFRPQRDAFTQGKVLRLMPEVYRSGVYVGEDQYEVLAKGFRQPFRQAPNQVLNQLHIADVGDSDGGTTERFFTVQPGDKINAGWPCVEGLGRKGYREVARKDWLRSKGYDTCDGVYNARDGAPGADPEFVEANFAYRDGGIDPDYPGCNDLAGAAVSAITHYVGDALADDYNYNIFFADYARGCVARFKGQADGSVDWSRPYVFLDGISVGTGVTHMETDPNTGFLYMLDHKGARLIRASSDGDVIPIGPDGDGGLQDVPEVLVVESACQGSALNEVNWVEAGNNSYEGELHLNGLEYTNQFGTTRTRAYDGTIPGPTMRMKPGGTYKLRLYNDHDLAWPNEPGQVLNTPQEPCSTNLHTHGLHISPQEPADYASLEIKPGEFYEYVYKIPADHSGGTHFYHNHHHGSSAIQAGAGGVGMLIVEDNPFLDGKPADWPQDMPEVLLSLQRMSPTSSASTAFLSKDMLYTSTATQDHSIFNGCDEGEYVMEIMEQRWTRLRILHVGRDTNIVLTVTPEDNEETACDMGLLALDGVYISPAPRMLADSRMFFSVASRVDVLIRCPAQGSHMLSTLEPLTGEAISSTKLQVVANTRRPDTEVLSQWKPIRPYYLEDLMGLGMEEAQLFSPSLENTGTINGVAYAGTSGPPLVTVAINKLQQWGISASGSHPFHIHVSHMQMTESLSNWEQAPNWFQPGDWVDTVSVPATVSVRFRPERFGGRTPMHCHVFEHATLGMAGHYDITGGAGPDGGLAIENWPSGLPAASCNGIIELGEEVDECTGGGVDDLGGKGKGGKSGSPKWGIVLMSLAVILGAGGVGLMSWAFINAKRKAAATGDSPDYHSNGNRTPMSASGIILHEITDLMPGNTPVDEQEGSLSGAMNNPSPPVS
ncbi:unnamed protein product [Chrysoparadoxa australica]